MRINQASAAIRRGEVEERAIALETVAIRLVDEDGEIREARLGAAARFADGSVAVREGNHGEWELGVWATAAIVEAGGRRWRLEVPRG